MLVAGGVEEREPVTKRLMCTCTSTKGCDGLTHISRSFTEALPSTVGVTLSENHSPTQDIYHLSWDSGSEGKKSLLEPSVPAASGMINTDVVAAEYWFI